MSLAVSGSTLQASQTVSHTPDIPVPAGRLRLHNVNGSSHLGPLLTSWALSAQKDRGPGQALADEPLNPIPYPLGAKAPSSSVSSRHVGVACFLFEEMQRVPPMVLAVVGPRSVR